MLLSRPLISSRLRQIYLRHGPTTLLECPFCDPLDPTTYTLYHISRVLLPHLLHFLFLGLSTSSTIAGSSPASWRRWAIYSSLTLLALDVYTTAAFNPQTDPNLPSPRGLFWTLSIVRPLMLCLHDILLAAFIYLSATGRFLLFTSASTDPETVRHQTQQMLHQANISLQTASTKLRAFTIARNAVVRDGALKETDDQYWRAVVAMEGPERDESIWADEEVQQAMARVYGSGAVDVGRVRKEAEAFVTGVTRGLDDGAFPS